MKEGQDKIAQRNEIEKADFAERFEAAIEKEQQNPTVTSVAEFCLQYGFSNRTLYKKVHAERLTQVQSLPSIQPRGNPEGWSKNAWYKKRTRTH